MKNKTRKNYTNKSNTKKANSYNTFGSLSTKVMQTPTYRGVKNKTKFPEFISLCKCTQKALKTILPKKLVDAGYTDVVVDDGYIYAKGTIPVLLTAHLDTVHKQTVQDFYEYTDKDGNHIISSPQGIGGDDRCGVYMILDIIKEFKPSILFCTDEEVGGVGSDKFCKTKFISELADLKYLIELDRANGTDAVFYDCDNPEFTEFITKNTGYKEAYGSFSDISNLAPECKVAAVNLSCGYYHAHTLEEEVNMEEMFNTIKTVKKLLTIECEQFEYIEKEYGFKGYGYFNYSGHYNRTRNWYDDWDDMVILSVSFYDETFKERIENIYASSEDKAWVKFFTDNPTVCWNHVLDFDVDYI